VAVSVAVVGLVVGVDGGLLVGVAVCVAVGALVGLIVDVAVGPTVRVAVRVRVVGGRVRLDVGPVGALVVVGLELLVVEGLEVVGLEVVGVELVGLELVGVELVGLALVGLELVALGVSDVDVLGAGAPRRPDDGGRDGELVAVTSRDAFDRGRTAAAGGGVTSPRAPATGTLPPR
jgi:hypothetical protein